MNARQYILCTELCQCVYAPSSYKIRVNSEVAVIIESILGHSIKLRLVRYRSHPPQSLHLRLRPFDTLHL